MDHLQYGRRGLAEVPEPATLLVLGSGLAGLTGVVWMKRRGR